MADPFGLGNMDGGTISYIVRFWDCIVPKAGNVEVFSLCYYPS
jgi:hypothetical protein